MDYKSILKINRGLKREIRKGKEFILDVSFGKIVWWYNPVTKEYKPTLGKRPSVRDTQSNDWILVAYSHDGRLSAR